MHTNNREDSSGKVCGKCQQQREQNGIQREKSSENITSVPLDDRTNSSANVRGHSKKNLSPQKPRRVQGPKQKQFIQSLLSKRPERDEKKSKRDQKMKMRQFVTEYQREFGKKRIKKAKKEEASKACDSVGNNFIFLYILLLSMLAIQNNMCLFNLMCVTMN